LQRIEDYRGLAILATNKKAKADEAFLRRLRSILDFSSPDEAGRREIWQKVFPPQAEAEELDFDSLARLEIAGGNIKNILSDSRATSGTTPTHCAHPLRDRERGRPHP
jgi:SpoVK/Ycf46/Vps4 family AAA+-type ATPase